MVWRVTAWNAEGYHGVIGHLVCADEHDAQTVARRYREAKVTQGWPGDWTYLAARFEGGFIAEVPAPRNGLGASALAL